MASKGIGRPSMVLNRFKYPLAVADQVVGERLIAFVEMRADGQHKEQVEDEGNDDAYVFHGLLSRISYYVLLDQKLH